MITWDLGLGGAWMGKKLYVGNLPFNVNDAILIKIFNQIGIVSSARIIQDKDTGKSKGYGFVEMASESEAIQAIDRFDGAEFEGRPLTVSEAHPQGIRRVGVQRARW